ncbi:hypothetical protein FACS1894127_3960 [Clostridia bacterium]|nr:hypothetical protein FACS1894127_3960 [Clostridia bacterium]
MEERDRRPDFRGVWRALSTKHIIISRRKVFDALCVGGKITLPPTETFYSVFHAAVTDKFGVSWNVVAEETPKKEKRHDQ